jgi:hypothetical protein
MSVLNNTNEAQIAKKLQVKAIFVSAIGVEIGEAIKTPAGSNYDPLASRPPTEPALRSPDL